MIGFIKLKLIDLIRNTNIVKEFRKIKCEVKNENLNLIQRNKLISLLIHIKEEVPFYKSLLINTSKEKILQNPYEVLKSLPIISKEDIAKDPESFISKTFIKHEKAYTGGSTGDPFKFFIDKKSISRTRGYLLYFWNKAINFKFNDKTIVIGGTSIKSSTDFTGKLYNYLQSRIVLEGSVLEECQVLKNLQILNNKNYQIIYGYPSSLEYYVDVAVKHNILYKKNIKGIITTSEMLSENQRTKIEKYFNAPVINAYGARDGGIVAMECSLKSGFHYNMQDCYVEEVISKDVNLSELIISNLDSYYMPLVRYKVGDYGSLNKTTCNCKSSLPRIVNLQGRTRDLIYISKDKKVHSSKINTLFKSFDFIEKYQIIQNKDYSINLIFKSNVDITEELKTNVINSLKSNLKFEFEIFISTKEEFIQSKNQKHKIVVSNVN